MRCRRPTFNAERSPCRGSCATCGEEFTGRADKKFCSDKCRTRHGRLRREQEMQETIRRLQKLAGLGI